MRAEMVESTESERVPPHLRALFMVLYLAGFRSLPDLRWRKHLAAQDWLLLAYLSTLLVATALGHGPTRAVALAWLGIDLTVLVAVLWATRSSVLQAMPEIACVLYRAVVPIPAMATFMQLHLILPVARHRTFDTELAALDARVFGLQPSLALDDLVSPGRTEWFAFFYYGYFAIIALHMIPMLFVRSDLRLLTRFSFGFLCVYCIGQALYVAVPAYGPYVFFDGRFEHPLAGSTWWPLVARTVQLGGARTDVFPSLHTAVPTYLSLFSFLHRARSPFRYTWFPLALFTTQIVLATLYLRWHYVVDVIAGLLLASLAMALGDVIARRERDFPTWPGSKVAGRLKPARAMS